MSKSKRRKENKEKLRNTKGIRAIDAAREAGIDPKSMHLRKSEMTPKELAFWYGE